MVLTVAGIHGDESYFKFRMREKFIDYYIDGQLVLQWHIMNIYSGRGYIRIRVYGGKVLNGKKIDVNVGEIYIRSMRAMFIGFDDIPLCFTCDDAFCSAIKELKAADKIRYIIAMPIAKASGKLLRYEEESPIIKRLRVLPKIASNAISVAELDRIHKRFQLICCELHRERPDLAMFLY